MKKLLTLLLLAVLVMATAPAETQQTAEREAGPGPLGVSAPGL